MTHSRSRSACAVRASADRPDTTHAPAPALSAIAGTSRSAFSPVSAGTSDAAGRGASSTMTCALVPLIPNADTPARRTRSPAGHGIASVSSRTSPADQSTCGEGSSAWSVRGSFWCRSASTILMTPAMPADAWVCPRLDLTEPSHNGRSSGRSWP